MESDSDSYLDLENVSASDCYSDLDPELSSDSDLDSASASDSDVDSNSDANLDPASD